MTDQLTEISPLLAVREALGLSVEDAAQILEQPAGVVVDLDSQPIEALAVLAQAIDKEGGEVILQIKNPDDTTFKEWKVTASGNFVEHRRDA